MLINVRTKAKEKATIYFSKSLSDHFFINNEQLFTLKIGMLEMPIWVRVYTVLDNDSIQLTSDIAKYFNLTTEQKFYIYVDNCNLEIRLGPLLGVFVNPRFFDSLANGNILESAQLMFNAANEFGGFLYYFTCNNIRWLDRKIKGVTLNKEGKVKQSWFCFPKVIYDRGVGFDEEDKNAVKFFRNQISQNKDVCFINSADYLDKWNTYRYLSKSSFLKDMLPETVLYTDVSDISDLLTKHSTVYLKARFGSRGKKILTVSPGSEGTLKIKTPYNEHTVANLLELESFIIEFFNSRPFIVQEPIKLYEYDGKKSDMRVLLCKDGQGKWQVIYNQVKIMDKNKPITNASMGGKVDEFVPYYTTVLGNDKQVEQLNNYISETAIKFAYALEWEVGPLGEMGLDLGLDVNLKLWFIEANTKPDKNPETFEMGDKGIFTQFFNIVKYANFLENFYGSGSNA